MHPYTFQHCPIYTIKVINCYGVKAKITDFCLHQFAAHSDKCKYKLLKQFRVIASTLNMIQQRPSQLLRYSMHSNVPSVLLWPQTGCFLHDERNASYC